MARPQKYKTEAERLQARRERYRRANKKKYDKLRKENNPVVYKLVNKLDKTFYIGSTKCLPIRLMAHPLLVFNRENWDIEVLFESEDEQAVRQEEIRLIRFCAGNKYLLNKELYENNNSNKNYNLLHKLLKREHEQLDDNTDFMEWVENKNCKELEEQLNEAKEMGY